MADGLHEVYFGGGDQPLVHLPLARASAATYLVEDLTESDDGPARELVASTAATVDSYANAITVAAGPGAADPRLLTFAAGVAPTVGRRYLLEHADGRGEIVRCVGGSTTTMRLLAPLQGTYPSGATVRGVEVSGTFPSAAAADENRFESDEPCRVTWTYTMRGLQWRVSELIRLQRSRAEARYLGDVVIALQEGWAELVMLAPPTGQSVENMVRYAARRLDSRLRGKNIEPAEFFSGEQGFDLLLQRTVLHFADSGFAPKSRTPDLFREEQRKEFAIMWDGLTVGSSGKGTTDVDRATDTAHAGPSKKSRSGFVTA
jgi:hypothetical protein